MLRRTLITHNPSQYTTCPFTDLNISECTNLFRIVPSQTIVWKHLSFWIKIVSKLYSCFNDLVKSWTSNLFRTDRFEILSPYRDVLLYLRYIHRDFHMFLAPTLLIWKGSILISGAMHIHEILIGLPAIGEILLRSVFWNRFWQQQQGVLCKSFMTVAKICISTFMCTTTSAKNPVCTSVARIASRSSSCSLITGLIFEVWSFNSSEFCAKTTLYEADVWWSPLLWWCHQFLAVESCIKLFYYTWAIIFWS